MNVQLWERCSNCGAHVPSIDMCGLLCSSCYIATEYNKLHGGSDEQQEGSGSVSGSGVVVHLPCHGVPAHESVRGVA